MIGEFFLRHEKVALLFSAGKDSAACLKLLAPWLNRLVVVWVNPGNPYPETVEYMEQVMRTVPNFLILQGTQPAYIREHGYPVDAVPIHVFKAGNRVNPWWNCCKANLWDPTAKLWTVLGFTGVIRGQKEADGFHFTIKSGDVVGGVEFLHPLETWTDEDVVKYVGAENLPSSYHRGLKSSLDCIDCTAHLGHSPGRLMDLKARHPETYSKISPILEEVRGVLNPVLAELNNGN